MKLLLIFTCFCACTAKLAAQPFFNAVAIAESLKKNAHSIVREETFFFDIKAVDKAYYTVHQVITVLDEAGKDRLEFVEFADKFHSLDDAEIRLFDASGKLLNKYSKKQLYVQSAGEGLVDEGKVYHFTVSSGNYPVTVQYDYTIRFNGVLNYPDYSIQSPGESIESSTFMIRVPKELDLRHKQQNTNITPVITGDEKNKIYQWQVKNQPSIEFEEGSVSRESRYPKIMVAPNKFELDDYPGDMTSWKNFGNWYAQLCTKTINLSPDRKQFFVDLVKDAPSEREKVHRVYSYLQNNFRYVSIQLGIGGFKPFDADFTDKKKYGDCKGLSNYVQACLNAVGIKSYQALINAGYNKMAVDAEFPHNSFNHAIVCVPLPGDSVWLECTSSSNDFAVLGNFTENRNALLITEDGGKLVPTPRSKSSSNLFSSAAMIKLNDNGSGTADVRLKNTGEFKQDMINYIGEEKKDDQKRFLVYYLGFIQPDEFEISFDKKKPDAETGLRMSFEKIPDFTAGTKLFLNPRIYKLWNQSLPTAENRRNDYYFESPFIKTDTTVYQLPDGYGIETLPKSKVSNFEFGSFKTSYTFDAAQKTVTSIAQLTLDEYRIPATKYAPTKRFFDEVMTEYAEKIVVKKL